MRRIAIAAVTLAVASSTIALASPASAATVWPVTVQCPSGGMGGSFQFSTSVTASAGDTVRVTIAGGWTVSVTSSGLTGPATADFTSTSDYTVNTNGGGSLTLTRTAGPPCNSGTLAVTGSSGGAGGGSSSSSATSSAPDPIVQQFGMPASGTCADTASESLNWGGASSGGWGESWAEWMHGGLGGAVCTRTLVYSTSSGAWTAS